MEIKSYDLFFILENLDCFLIISRLTPSDITIQKTVASDVMIGTNEHDGNMYPDHTANILQMGAVKFAQNYIAKEFPYVFLKPFFYIYFRMLIL